MGREEKSPGKRTAEGLEFSAQALLALTKPHIESFDYFVDRGLQAAVLGVQPVQVTHPMLGNTLRIWIEKPAITPPMRDLKDSVHSVDHRLLPAECRQAGLSYRGNFTADVCLQANDKSVMRQSISFGRMPIMVKSSICHLRGLEQQRLIAAKEESLEMGGYFICNGIERVIRLLIVPKRNYPMGLIRGSFKNRGPSYSDKAVMIRCVRPDQSSVTMRLYYLQTGNAKLGFAIRKQEYLVPVGIILKALIEVSEKEIYEHISCIHNDRNKGERGAVGSEFVSQRARIILEEVKRLQLHTRTECLKFLGETFRPVLDGVENQSVTQIGEKVLVDFVLVHLDNNYDKFNLVILMLQKLFALADATAAADNADVMQHHELLLPGHLLTMFVKERFQDWLAKVKLQLIKEMEEKPHQVDLLDREAHDLNPLRPIGPLPKEYLQQVNKAMEKVPSDIGKRVEYLLNTGNLVSPGGLDLQQTSGFTVVAEKLNFFRYLSHFRSVHRGAFFAQLRTTAVRKLLPESWGFMCPVHTPDGSPCGLLMHLTCTCQISSDLDAKGIMKDPLRMRKGISSILVGMGMIPALPQLARVSPPEYLAVLLDGRVLGYMRTRDIPQAVSQLRVLKTSQVPDVPEDLEVAYVPCTNAGAFPGLFLASTPARFVRPVLQLFQTDTEEPKTELIGPFEQAYMEIKCLDGGDGGRDKGAPPPTHQEISPTGMLSIVANLTPWSDHNQSPRNMYQCQMGKQTMGFPAQALQFRADNKMYRLQTPQSPIARTATYKKYGMDEFPNGTNAVVAVLAYTGYDMEDAMIINKSSMERGLAHGQIYKTEIVDLTRLRRKGDGIVYQFKKAEDGRKVPYHSAKDQFIDRDGLPYIGQVMKEGDSYCSVLNTMLGKPKTSKIKGSDVAVVDYVAALGTGPKDPMQKVAIRMRYGRNPVIGDKFSSRHGQKGVLSNLWPDIDMPFSAVTGMRPDIIINPHAFPSRMTIGMLIESIAAKAGALRGEFVDASPFKKCRTTKVGESGIDEKQSAIDEFGKQLAAFGFSYHGTEVMYSGLLGTEMPCEIFMGVVYYQRLRHMVGDKFQVRSLGPVNPVTRQPVKGRKLGGGIRFGEMERDSLLAHGAAYLLQDRLHTCSDYHTADVCSLCGSLLSPVPAYDASHPAGQAKSKKVMCRVCKTSRGIEKVAMPYVFRYLAAELAAMNIKMYLKTSAPP